MPQFTVHLDDTTTSRITLTKHREHQLLNITFYSEKQTLIDIGLYFDDLDQVRKFMNRLNEVFIELID